MKTLNEDFPLPLRVVGIPDKSSADISGLDLLRAPFPAHQISMLPKPTKAQTDAVKADFKAGIRCNLCGGWHHPKVVHLDYVGHAAITDRLLDADPSWSWEPVAFGQDGCPVIDKDGGLWIRLTVCGVTRLGYGSADGKTGGDAMKERIGDALRNSAMRFGAALDLWHKGQLHIDDDPEPPPPPPKQEKPPCPDAKIERWFANVTAGKAIAADLMAYAVGIHSLTDEQEGKILAFVATRKVADEAIVDAEFVAEYEKHGSEGVQ